MNIYAAFGFKEFLVAGGYKAQIIKEYFLHFNAYCSDMMFDLKANTVDVLSSSAPDWLVSVVDTGSETLTGGRIARLEKWIDNQPFMVTYGDGLANVDVTSLVEFHRSHGKKATVTAVRSPARFGLLELDDIRVSCFEEKKTLEDGWINGGFFVFEPSILEYISGDSSSLEHETLVKLAADKELMAYKHDGFWQPMDTLREKRLLEELWQGDETPWKVW
ncbi:MAG: sugar phosphate nucleotidyltransferase [Desulfobacula sp.]|nr:sugar phosphate nucleotidyltransferase [Desulfobacula sp.]